MTDIPKESFETFIFSDSFDPSNSNLIPMDDGIFFELLSQTMPDPILWSSTWPSRLSLEPITTTNMNINNNNNNNNNASATSTATAIASTSVTVTATKRSSNARLGYCQHPKHMYYRVHGLHPHPPSTPRRGRPPKGVASVPSQHLMTVRPLPKRLEQVVGESSIKVCLTCLKRSDLDQAYTSHPLYIGPQQLFKSTNQ